MRSLRKACSALLACLLFTGQAAQSHADEETYADEAWFVDVTLRRGDLLVRDCAAQSDEVGSTFEIWSEYAPDGRQGFALMRAQGFGEDLWFEGRVGPAGVPYQHLGRIPNDWYLSGQTRIEAEEDGDRVRAAWANWGARQRCIVRLNGAPVEPRALPPSSAIALRVHDFEGLAAMEAPLSTVAAGLVAQQRYDGVLFGMFTPPDLSLARAYDAEGAVREGRVAIFGEQTEGSWRFEVDAGADARNIPWPLLRTLVLPR